MSRYILFAPLFVIPSFTIAQFGAARIIEETETPMPHSVFTADLDGDGDADVLSGDQERIVWFANDGTGAFGTAQVIEGGPGQVARCVRAADLDGDGDPDVLSASWGPDLVSWYVNDGAGNFGSAVTISAQVDGPTTVQAIDMDNDADLDVMSACLMNDEIAWHENDGAGGFGPKQVLASFYELWFAQAVDLDADADIDLLCSSANTDEVAWFENDGTNNFGPQQPVAAQVDGANYAYAADLDGDGDNDVLSAAWIDDEIAWYENLGGGAFGPQQVITNATNYARFVHATDLDGDGDNDVLSASSLDDKVAWYENNGAGNFGPQQVITLAANWATSLHVADLDNDGYVDVLSTSWYDDKVAWYASDGSGGFGSQQVITTSVKEVVQISTADIDGDGDKDVVTGSREDSKLAWYANLGNGTLGSQQVMTTYPYGLTSMAIADLDGDGDLDLAATAYAQDNDWTNDQVSWYANDGTGSFGPPQILASPFNPPKSVIAFDADNDADHDLAWSNGTNLYFLENDGVGNFTSATLPGGNCDELYAHDLNGDGAKDLIAAISFPGSLAWWPNNGTGGFPAMQTFQNDGMRYEAIHVTDLDNDQDPDVLSASSNNDMIAWYENDGAGNFGLQQAITILADSAISVGTADFDGDGDQDVYSTSCLDNKVAWYTNDGSGTFGPQQVISNTVLGVVVAHAADLDGDGDPEMITGAGGNDAQDWYWTSDHHRIAWHENHMDSPYRIEGTVFNDEDMDGILGVGDTPFPWTPVSVSPFVSTTFTEASGAFTAFVDTGLYDVEALVPNALWTLTTGVAVQPAQVTTLAPVIAGIDFGFAPLVDTSIVVPSMTLGAVPCGDTTWLWISYANQGTRIEQGVISLELDTLFTFISSQPTPTAQWGNQFEWAFDSLALFGVAGIAAQVQRPPADSLGSTWYNAVSVLTDDGMGTTTGAFSAEDAGIVACAFDPNDKQVDPPGYGAYGAVPMDTEWLNYTIRFQNTGTDTALNVVVRDQLGSALEWNSLQLLGTSHALSNMLIEADGEAVFNFSNIQLPDSNVNGPASQGYVKFRIRPEAGSPSGTSIPNTAEIHFDFNAPVITNTVLNTLIDCNLYTSTITYMGIDLLQASEGESYQWYLDGLPIAGATSQELLVPSDGSYTVEVTSVHGCTALSDDYQVIGMEVEAQGAMQMAVMPNPAHDQVRLIVSEPITAEHVITLTDVHGRGLRTLSGKGSREVIIDLGGLPQGLYMVLVRGSVGVMGTSRVVVE